VASAASAHYRGSRGCAFAAAERNDVEPSGQNDADIGLSRRSLLARTALGAGVSGSAVLLAACGDDDEGEASAGENRRGFTFAYPQSGGTERFLRVIRNGAEQAARDLGVEVKITATKKFDQVEQGRLVRAAAASNPDGIITGIWDGDIMRDPVTSAADDGIPVVVINTGADFVEPFGALTYVGWDEFQIAVDAGVRMKEEGARNVLAVNHEVGSLPLDIRLDGFKKGFGASMRTIGVEGTDPVDARNRIRSAIGDGSEFDALLALGQPSGDPALLALRDAGKNGEILFATFDFSPTLLDAIKGGDITFAVDQQQYLQGYYPVVVLTLLNQYQFRPPPAMLTTGGFITKDNAAAITELAEQTIR
jgi:simple sugar transport system substrate-binding protein